MTQNNTHKRIQHKTGSTILEHHGIIIKNGTSVKKLPYMQQKTNTVQETHANTSPERSSYESGVHETQVMKLYIQHPKHVPIR